MNEVEKMYENCNFKKSMGVGSPLALYPFTAEKQLNLIKWLAENKADVLITYSNRLKRFAVSCGYGGCGLSKNFEIALAMKINLIWQDLTEEEKQQVKGILE